MSHRPWHWLAGGALFAGIVAMWVWQLPGIIEDAKEGKSDEGLGMILRSLGGAAGTVKENMAAVGDELDGNLKNINQTLEAKGAQAQAIEQLKRKIGEQQAAKDVVPAPAAPDDNSNVNKPDAR